ncbi:G patch domain and ankyrin repeat-containing protein 1 isoform a, partial [Silurus asotus]
EEKKRGTERRMEMKRGRSGALNGAEVRKFYQSLFEDEDRRRDERKDNRKDEWSNKRRSERRERLRERTGWKTGVGGVENSVTVPPAGHAEGYRLLRCAEQGDVQGVEDALRRGCGVNFTDHFNWTALMSAAYSGRTHTVKVLLHQGALCTTITDTQGRNACDLARLSGHHDVVNILEQFRKTHKTHTSHTPAAPAHSSPSPQWCDVCEVCYTDTTQTHTSSTLHQFSLKHPPSLPHYCLTPTSVGYKMMLRLGWDPHSGLGPGHSGRRDPVGTVFKSDTAGLGFGPKPRPKVTHFKANDVQAVRRVDKRLEERRERETTVSAKVRKRTEERERQWERDYRASFNIDT